MYFFQTDNNLHLNKTASFNDDFILIYIGVIIFKNFINGSSTKLILWHFLEKYIVNTEIWENTNGHSKWTDMMYFFGLTIIYTWIKLLGLLMI